ncbi:hypothetical protein MATR_27190 [Marivirga tractuosa]|uniref:MORN variant repeat-containing protein n=1 Tax=Marivirga tractuosa (strain ATCC 23168 / DSM 4126 / NBRC 15989 / NCIMB 1408 / VKM B-1430 / H-43) TaxID=643867 RepID=E4TMJ7_MARTH|nr:hypothetical protein [Marivirga tractuosa]ADR23431.1 hypothetical protein Ftrac_3457 [Marivirga tractuosa DSM 4126]BDD15894.1 hypothetical protein MATR_27190 [Marivirga tractuosa]
MKSTKKYILLKIIALLLLSSWTQAQNIQIYDSTYTIDNTKYLAKYEYYISEEDTIYNGEFSLSQQFENREDIYEYLSLEGYFIENRADETWKLKEGSFEPTGDGYYKDYTYSYDVNGHEFMAIGNFIVGEKTGVWELYDWQIRNSKISDTTLTASINFEKGKAKGEFRLSIENNILEGEIGENELTQGTWSFYKVSHSGEKELIKEWIFDENSIVAMHLYRNEEVQKIIIEKPISADLLTENLLLDHKFLEIIDLKAKIYNEQLLKKYKEEDKISNLYFTLLENLDLVDQSFSPITKSNIKPEIKSKLQAAPITEKELALLQKVKEKFETNQEKAQSILSNPQFNIASVSTNKVAEAKNVLEDINDFILIPTQEILALHENEQLKFFERDKLIQYKIDLRDKSAINSIFNSDTLSQDYEFQSQLNFSNNQSNLFRLFALMNAIEVELILIKEHLHEYLQEIQEEEKLVELENAMLAKYEKTNYLADSLITGEHDNFAGIDVAKAIVDFTDAQLAFYSNLTTIEEKTRAIEPLIQCFNRTEELIYTINKAPESIYKINEAYTKEVFNPYTFTNMEEKSKPSIYKAFNKLLLPGIFQNMQNLSCDNIRAYQANFKVLYDEMIDVLNEENTNRKERKVKRTNTAKEAAEVLDMELSF